MDIWMLACMFMVAMALFEYAILLAIRFGKLKKVNVNRMGENDALVEERCRRIDRHALRMFLAISAIKMGIYFFTIYSFS